MLAVVVHCLPEILITVIWEWLDAILLPSIFRESGHFKGDLKEKIRKEDFLVYVKVE